jgi:putative endonuclease
MARRATRARISVQTGPIGAFQTGAAAAHILGMPSAINRRPASSAVQAAERARRGACAEERAAQRLQRAGYRILLRNYRCRGGELDIVARRGPLLLIVEVRLRSNHAFGGPAASISAAKRRRLLFAARHLLARHPQLARLTVRFDALLAHAADESTPLEWLEAVM